MRRWLKEAAGFALAITVSACSDNANNAVIDPNVAETVARVAAMSPAPGHDYVAADQPFVVEFTEPMDPASVEVQYAVMRGEQRMQGAYDWSEDHRAMSFEPGEALHAGEEVEVHWGAGMQDAHGNRVHDAAGEPMTDFAFTCTIYDAPESFASAGEQIYLTGTSSSAGAITFIMGDDFDDAAMPGYGAIRMMGGMMGEAMGGGTMGGGTGMGDGLVRGHAGIACASCHGPAGKGGRYLAMGLVRAPSIEYGVLTGQQAHADGAGTDDGHEHLPYDDEGIARAISQGLNPEGERLNGFMPRWSMSSADLDALIDYLRTL